MRSDVAPVARWRCGEVCGAQSALIVLLHGRGSDEDDLFALADHLPTSAHIASLRAPLALGSGFTWFENRGVGRPVAESLAASIDYVHDFLDNHAGDAEEIWLVGFSAGAAMAGGLILENPERFAGAALLHGTLPFDAGQPTLAGRLTDVPVLYGTGAADDVIPSDLIARSSAYLRDVSGADLTQRTYPNGHSISSDELSDLGSWLALQFSLNRPHHYN